MRAGRGRLLGVATRRTPIDHTAAAPLDGACGEGATATPDKGLPVIPQAPENGAETLADVGPPPTPEDRLVVIDVPADEDATRPRVSASHVSEGPHVPRLSRDDVREPRGEDAPEWPPRPPPGTAGLGAEGGARRGAGMRADDAGGLLPLHYMVQGEGITVSEAVATLGLAAAEAGVRERALLSLGEGAAPPI